MHLSEGGSKGGSEGGKRVSEGGKRVSEGGKRGAADDCAHSSSSVGIAAC